MQSSSRRAIITLAVAGSIILAAPALGHAQGTTRAPSQGATVYSHFGAHSDAPAYAGLSFQAPSVPADVQQSENDNEWWGNDNAVAANDNSFDDNEDTGDNGNDNTDFADEAAFLKSAVTDSATELEAGRLAQDQGNNVEVRQLGERLAREHEATMYEAASIAASHGVQTDWQPADGDEQQRIANLEERSGDEFDRYFLRAFVLDQRADIETYRLAKDNATDDVAQFSEQRLWMLEDQLRAAEDLASRLGVDVS